MKKILFLLLTIYSFSAYSQKNPNNTFVKHGVNIVDEYTWLEKINSDETKKWVEEKNTETNTITEEIKKKINLEKKIREYNTTLSRHLPRKKGKYFYSMYRNENNKLSTLFYRKKLEDDPIEIINLNKIYNNNNSVVFGGYYPSKSSSIIAIKTSIDGSDNLEVRFIDMNTKTPLNDVIKNIKFSDISWNLDYGVFYKKNSNLNSIAKDSTNQLFYHKIGSDQKEDKLIFDSTKSESTINFYTTRGKLIIIETNKEETTSNYYQASLIGEEFYLDKFIENQSTNMQFLDYKEGKIFYSSKDFDWGEIRSFDIKNRANEAVIIPQIYNHLLEGSYFTDDYIFCKYKTLGKNYIRVFDSSGKFIRKFDAQDGTEFSINFYDDVTKNLFVTLHSYVIQSHNYTLNIETGEIKQYYNSYIKPSVSIFPTNYFDVKCITYKSRDNKDVPITIVHKKGMELNGSNPTLLKAYGGFGVVNSARFSIGLLCFLEKGGVYAFAEIRGGGEKGLKWQIDGKGLKKMNSFNDFIDAAEFLIKEKYTSPDKLAITGASNGGLVVGVAMTQRPELFKFAIPEMGAFDMVKFDQYTIGKYHYDEYGNPEIKEEFNSLLAYSPYHNIKENVNYPTTLIITSDNDDRVPPLHSYKFAAKLQNRVAQKNPIYLKTHDNAGHYGKVSTYDEFIKNEAEFYDFILYHLNY